MVFAPWPHQIHARDELRKSVADGWNRVCCVAPCGAGKSYIAGLVLEGSTEKGKSALVLAPQIELVDQMAKKFNEDYGLRCGIIMAGRPYEPWKKIQIASIQTLLSRRIFPEADVIIQDEAHLFASDLRQDFLQHYPGIPIIGLTATPIGPNGSGLGHSFDKLVQAATYAELRKAGVLVPCIIFSVGKLDMTGVKVTAGEWNQKQTAQKMQPLIGDIHEHWVRHANGRRTILFAASVAQSKWICEHAFRRNGIPADHVDGTMTKSEREPIYAKLRSGEIKVCCSCDVLSQGIDIPELECAVNAAPTKSRRKWRQRMGRILRACRRIGKQNAIIIDHAGSHDIHGYPDEDVDWELEDSVSVVQKEVQRQMDQESRSIKCPKCQAEYRENGITCPYCGHTLQTKKKTAKPEVQQGTLVYVSPRDKIRSQLVDEQKTWNTCLAIAANRGGTFKMALKIFRTKTGKWPDRNLKKLPEENQRATKVAIVFPGFVRTKAWTGNI